MADASFCNPLLFTEGPQTNMNANDSQFWEPIKNVFDTNPSPRSEHHRAASLDGISNKTAIFNNQPIP